MNRIFISVFVAILILTVACHKNIVPGTQLQVEKDPGFEMLFDGTSTDGWRGYQKEHLPGKWVLDNGTLHFDPSGKGDGGTIVFDKIFANFHMKMEWKIAKGGNSGIFYLGSEDPAFNRIYQTAPEMQVLDNARHPDANMGKEGNRKASSLYDLIPANPQNFKGAGEWNQVEVIHKDGHVIHMMNGEKVVEYQVGTKAWDELVSGSKFPGLNPTWANLPSEGYIGLQDHGDKVWFRNIQIKEL
ncbi:MAG: DUF1080 domain-containing protein [Bacteroidota bacterium]